MQWNWLHLSDLHFGARAQSWLWPRIEQQFFEDLSRLHERAGPWDAVLFTGDLVQKGLRVEFAQLDDWLQRLWSHLRSLGSRPSLVAVPGNHDLIRPAPGSAAAIELARYASEKCVPAEFWQSSSSEVRALVDDAFANYQEWWSRSPLRPQESRTGILRGDCSCTLRKGALRIGVVGLNTAFLQLADGNFKDKLALHPRQFHGVCQSNNGPEWVGEHHLGVLLTHQPPDWLMPAAWDHLRGEIAPPRQFAVHLFGHMHEPGFTSISEGGSHSRNHFQGASLFGLEEFSRDGNPMQRIHGYAAGRLEVRDERVALLSFWPRIARRKKSGELALVPDTSYDLQPGEHTAPIEVSLLTAFNAGKKSVATPSVTSSSVNVVIEGSAVRDVLVTPAAHATSVAVTRTEARDIKIG